MREERGEGVWGSKGKKWNLGKIEVGRSVNRTFSMLSMAKKKLQYVRMRISSKRVPVAQIYKNTELASEPEQLGQFV